jgi:uncharacterized protein (DUF2345 family)
MAQQSRNTRSKEFEVKMGSGVYLGKVISVMDPTFNGKLRVTLLRDQGNTIGDDNQTYIVNYASPFFGQTPFEAMGKNNNDFNDTQKSYGMWFVPPDVGVTVLCLFANGNPGEGYWFACLPPSFSNHMVPAIGGTTEVDLSDEDKKKYNTKQPLPVGEINKRKNTEEQEKNAELIKKPVHPIADEFLTQGTLEDDVRGVTTTTSRRQVPNSVFGILTPGPLDWRNGSKRMNTGPTQNQSLSAVAVSRLGGTQLVFDDGDDRYQRKEAPSTGPMLYADVNAGEKGQPNIPYNEYARLRTRTGHQILLHNSEDLIYIANSKGTAWVELSSNGKIDIYGADSISVHSETDLNIRADRDVNIEAGRNINMKATAEYVSPDELHRRDDNGNIIRKIADANNYESGRIQIESAFNTNILIGANGKIETRSYNNAEDILTPGSLDIKVAGNTRIEQFLNFDLKTGQRNTLTAGTNTEINSGENHIETAPRIDMNGPEARKADDALVINDLITFDNIFTNTGKGWSEKYYDGTIASIMRRMPMHEPWPLHENLAPNAYTPDATDREFEEE